MSPTRRDDQVDETTDQQPARLASALEPAAVQAAQEANERDDLPNADTDTKEAEKAAKGRS